ncbi:hypothetical protein BGZ95_007703 [Linnemannia exigua]|uniref:F-box domain-containing protein n=1 Tax=Linnemannia exigua TaxID=604196 RepID=A0AAD4H7P5_9FUNG|nr:hypothetical protein BGZ95_007703 [Linnemannia exigua]
MSPQESSPFTIPEILLHVYTHLDTAALITCAQVSHFWRRWSLHHMSASAFVPSSDILGTFARQALFQDDSSSSSDGAEDSEDEGAKDDPTASTNMTLSAPSLKPYCLEELVQRGSEIRSLTIGDRWNGGKPRMRATPTGPQWSAAVPPNLTLLEHIGFRLFSPELFWADERIRTRVMNDLVEQNPQLRSLEYSIFKAPWFSPLLDILLDHPLQHLKRLEVQSRMTGEDFGALFTALIMRSGCQEIRRRRASPPDGSPPDTPKVESDSESTSESEQEQEQGPSHPLAVALLPQLQEDSEMQPAFEESGESGTEEPISSGVSESEGEEDEDEEDEEEEDEDEENEDGDGELYDDEWEDDEDDAASESNEAPFTFTNDWRDLEFEPNLRWLEWQYSLLDRETRAKLTVLPNLDLEELVIRNIGPMNATKHLFDNFLRQCYLENGLKCMLPSVRSLTIQNFDLRHYLYNIHPRDRNPDLSGPEFALDIPILVHLCQRFPNLETLRVAPDPAKLREPLHLPIQYRIRDIYQDLDSGGHVMVPENGIIGMDIPRICPNLKDIDFSHQREITDTDWDMILMRLRHQLESVAAWNVSDLGPRELLSLVPPSPAIIDTFGTSGHLSQRWSGLQELDISANPKLGSAVHMLFKYVPTLRILRALGVPVNGTRLVGFDWVCKDLELLSINIFIPSANFKPKITWVWNMNRDGWDVLPDPVDGPANMSVLLTEEGEPASSLLAAGDEGADDMGPELQSQQRQERRSIRTSHFDYSDSEDSDDGGAEGKTTKSREDDEAYQRWRANEDKKIEATTAHSVRIQQQICQQLGRLTKLRELTLEGYQSDLEDQEGQFMDCLHLTLKTGLDYLRPLRKNLEKLVVNQLDEELCGRAEMEWIAQNWVNYADGVWQKKYMEWKASKGKPIDELSQDLLHEMPRGAKDPLLPSPTFKKLIGMGVRRKDGGRGRSERRANGNVAWLQRQCPRLEVVKEDADHPKVRSNFDPYFMTL